jgi:hypothetical protein
MQRCRGARDAKDAPDPNPGFNRLGIVEPRLSPRIGGLGTTTTTTAYSVHIFFLLVASSYMYIVRITHICASI